jgi:hypothetical protein
MHTLLLRSCACVHQFNIFGRTFQAVLENEDNEVQWDTSRRGFDASVVYIHK